MRPYFSDGDRLLAQAKQNTKSGASHLRRWWSGKYNLPPNHALFMEQSQAELTLEMYEDFIAKKEELEYRLEEATAKEAQFLMRQLTAINKILGDDNFTGDPLIDKWEREIAEGKIPDLDE